MAFIFNLIPSNKKIIGGWEFLVFEWSFDII